MSAKLPFLVLPRTEAEEKLRLQIGKGIEIRDQPVESYDDLQKLVRQKYRWSDYSKELLARLFDHDSEAKKYYRDDLPSVHGLPLERSREHFKRFFDSEIEQLESLLQRLDLIPEQIANERQETKSDASASDVFIVHGHDETAKLSVARFIERLGLKVVILHEQPNAGRTIIDKIENHANVAFVVVLLTPDDVVYSKKDPGQKSFRARQNVIFELGYFIGKLGRGKVCALWKEDVEIPSDYHGVLFVTLDPNDGWQTKLAKEMKAAGLQFDITKLV